MSHGLETAWAARGPVPALPPSSTRWYVMPKHRFGEGDSCTSPERVVKGAKSSSAWSPGFTLADRLAWAPDGRGSHLQSTATGEPRFPDVRDLRWSQNLPSLWGQNLLTAPHACPHLSRRPS
jgi:hypothetical protein